MSISSISNIASNFCAYIPSNCYVQGTIAVSAISLIVFNILKYAGSNSPEPIVKDIKPVVKVDPPIKKWKVKERGELHLIKKEKDLYWVFFQKAENKKYTSLAINDAYVYETYARNVPKEKDRELILQQGKDLRNWLNTGTALESEVATWLREQVPLDHRISFFEASDFDKLKCHKNGFLYVKTKLCTFTSQYGRVGIDRDNWAITVACRVNKQKGVFNRVGHSVLIYEGVERGEQFLRYAHVVNDGENSGYALVIHKIDGLIDGTKEIMHSRTWQRSSLQVTKMVESIELDIRKQVGGYPYGYSVAGGMTIPENLFYIGKYLCSLIYICEGPRLNLNCHTWVVFKLRYADIIALDFINLIWALPVTSIPFLKI